MRRHNHSGGGGGGVNLALIVTPMLDMSFQLLAFFIAVYSPNAAEQFIGGELGRTKSVPTESRSGPKIDKGEKKDVTPTVGDAPPELEQQYTVFVTAQHPREKGGAVKFVDSKEGVRAMFVQIKSPANVLDREDAKNAEKILDLPPPVLDRAKDVANKKEAFGKVQLALEDLYKEATGKTKAEAKADKKEDPSVIKTKIRIEADRNIQFDYVIQVYAAAKRAGFDDVTFTTPLD